MNRVTIALVILGLLYICNAQNNKFSANFLYHSPDMTNGGQLPGLFYYDWNASPYPSYFTNFTSLSYSVLYQFNQWHGEQQSPVLANQFVTQWRFRAGPGCPGGCETGQVTNSMPRLWLDTNVYDSASANTDPDVPNCYKYTIKSGQQPSGVSSIWFTTTTASTAKICQAVFTDGTSFVFSNVNTNPTIPSGAFTSPSGCTCNKPIDVALALDRSGSVTIAQWNSMYSFLQGFAKSFTWSTDKANLAIVNFNTIAFGYFNPTTYASTAGYGPSPVLGITGNSANIINTIKALNCCKSSTDTSSSCCDGWTSISSGVRAAVDELAKSKRTDAAKVVCIITDGKQNTVYNGVGGACYTGCCNWAVGSDCPDGVYGPGKYPGAQYLYCIGDTNYDTIADEFQVGKVTNPWACGTTVGCGGRNPACGCANAASCCDGGKNNNGCNGTNCTPLADVQHSMQTCHTDLINAREYGYKRLGTDTYFYAVGVGDASVTELEIITNNRYKRPVGTPVSVPITWNPTYNLADRTNPERVMAVDGWDKLAGLLLELTTKICDTPAVACGSCCGFCICGACQPPTSCAQPSNKCQQAVIQNGCCVVIDKPCPTQNCKTCSCDPNTGFVQTDRPCTPASDSCFNYTCNPADNKCYPVKNWQDSTDPCFSTYCNTAVNPPQLVVRQPKDCSAVQATDKCNTYSCSNGNCVPTPIAYTGTPATKCETLICNPNTGWVKTTNPCNPINQCSTAKCNTNTGVCEQTPVICNDVNNKCDISTCNTDSSKGGPCAVKAYTSCPASSDKCVGTPTCNPSTGKCDYPARTTCKSPDCRQQNCSATSGVCEFIEAVCPTICQTTRCDDPAYNNKLPNQCYTFKCDGTKLVANCDIATFTGSTCDSLKLGDKCIDNVTCVNNTGCVPTYHPNCGSPANKCNIYVRNSSLDGCCQEVKNVTCNFGDPCYIYADCVPATGLCPAPVAKCSKPSTPCFDRGCTAATGQCYEKPTVCAPIPCFVNLGCNDTLGGCQRVALNCDDKNACTADSCNALTGKCVNTDISSKCDDSNPCTDDACLPSVGCTHSPHNCSDAFACTKDSCNPAVKGGCVHTPDDELCNDFNLCTNESCSVTKGCVNVNVVCPQPSECELSLCRPTYGCKFEELLCVLDANNNPVLANTSRENDPTLTDDQRAQAQKLRVDAQTKLDDRRKGSSDCSYAVCRNSTCEKVQIACAGLYDVTTLVAGTITGGIIAAIVIAAIVAAVGCGGGVYYVANNAGIGGDAHVQNNPLYSAAGHGGENPLAENS